MEGEREQREQRETCEGAGSAVAAGSKNRTAERGRDSLPEARESPPGPGLRVRVSSSVTVADSVSHRDGEAAGGGPARGA
eukprot:3941384-Rhodomonas_salina.2